MFDRSCEKPSISLPGIHSDRSSQRRNVQQLQCCWTLGVGHSDKPTGQACARVGPVKDLGPRPPAGTQLGIGQQVSQAVGPQPIFPAPPSVPCWGWVAIRLLPATADGRHPQVKPSQYPDTMLYQLPAKVTQHIHLWKDLFGRVMLLSLHSSSGSHWKALAVFVWSDIKENVEAWLPVGSRHCWRKLWPEWGRMQELEVFSEIDGIYFERMASYMRENSRDTSSRIGRCNTGKLWMITYFCWNFCYAEPGHVLAHSFKRLWMSKKL